MVEETLCPRCGQVLESGVCPVCGEVYLHRCPRCGNMLVFEQVTIGGLPVLRCGVCSNETDFEMVALHRDGSPYI